MKKVFTILFIVTTFVLLTIVNIKTANARKEPWELGYGVWKTYSCGSTCNWARCEKGSGDCTYADQYTCPC